MKTVKNLPDPPVLTDEDIDRLAEEGRRACQEFMERTKHMFHVDGINAHRDHLNALTRDLARAKKRVAELEVINADLRTAVTGRSYEVRVMGDRIRELEAALVEACEIGAYVDSGSDDETADRREHLAVLRALVKEIK